MLVELYQPLLFLSDKINKFFVFFYINHNFVKHGVPGTCNEIAYTEDRVLVPDTGTAGLNNLRDCYTGYTGGQARRALLLSR